MARPNINHTSQKQLDRRKAGIIKAKSSFFRNARYGLTCQDQRLIFTAILINQQDSKPLSDEVTITVKDFAALCNLKGKSPYSTLKQLSTTLTSRVLEVIYTDEKGKHLLQTPWLLLFRYNFKEATVNIKINPEIIPFIEGKPYSITEYAFILNYTCQYSERLYEIIASLDHKPLIDIEIDDLRTRLAIPKEKYTNYSMFRKRVVNPAIEEINKWTPYNIEVREKRGAHNKIVTVLFAVSKNEKIEKLAIRIANGEYAPPLSDEKQDELMKEIVGDEIYPNMKEIVGDEIYPNMKELQVLDAPHAYINKMPK